LGFWTGSDSQAKLLLPFDLNLKEQLYWHDITFNIEDEIIVYEYNSEDTILMAENFRTLQKQAIGKGWQKCESAFPHYCIKNARIEDKILKLNWDSYFFSEIQKGHDMKIKLDI